MQLYFTQTAYPPSIGGAQAYLHALACGLQPRHAVRVSAFWREHRTDWLLGVTVRAPGGRPYTLDGVPVFPLNLTRADKWRALPWVISYYLLTPIAAQRLADQLMPHLRAAAETADLVHHGRVGREPLALASLALARERGVPFVLTPFHHPRWGGYRHRLYHELYRQADALLALTAAERDTLIALGAAPERIHVTGTGPILAPQPDPAAFRRAYNLTGSIVLFLGQKFPYKGFETLLQAAPAVWRTHPQTHFVFIGPRTGASRRVFSRVTDPRIVELGGVSVAEKTNALAACTLLCTPSTQESFGGVYVEAWSLGKPVIAAQIPAVACVVADGQDGFLVSAEPSQLAEKIALLLDNPALCATMGAAGHAKVVDRYSWPVLVRQTESIYAQLRG